MNYDRKFMYMLVICSSYLIDYQLFTNTDACHAYTHLQSQNMHEHTHTHSHTHTHMHTHTCTHRDTHTHSMHSSTFGSGTHQSDQPVGKHYCTQSFDQHYYSHAYTHSYPCTDIIKCSCFPFYLLHFHEEGDHIDIKSVVVVFDSISCTSMWKVIT